MPKSHKDYWTAKFEANSERDARKIAELEAAGWTVVVVWECEIRAASNDTVGRIAEALRSCD